MISGLEFRVSGTRPWDDDTTVAVLATASEKGRLERGHYASIFARADFDDLKNRDKYGEILHAAVQARRDGYTEQCALGGPTLEDAPLAACMPIYYNWFAEGGLCVGASFHGYQCYQFVVWSSTANRVKDLFFRKTPTAHFGEARFEDVLYSLTLMQCFEGARANEDVLCYRAAMKRLGPSADAKVVAISFGGGVSANHDFAHHVFVSPLLTMSRAALLKAKGEFSLGVDMRAL